MPKWIMGPDGCLQKVPDDMPVESIVAESVTTEATTAAPIPQPIPNPDNIPGLETAQWTAPNEAQADSRMETLAAAPEPESKPERFPILDNYGTLSYEDLYALHYNREKPRACAMSDDDLLKAEAELELIVQIGKIRQRIFDDVRRDRIESKSKTAKEKQRLKDASFKVKNRETIKKEAEAKEAKEKKPRESQAEQMARFMGITVDEAHVILNSKKGA
jgi:hypothetical protein